MVTPLISSADDYAQVAAIDAGILSLINQGRLTATSCLSFSPRWREAASAITSEIRQQADIGLHIDFTQYSQPVRHSHPQVVIRSLLRGFDRQQIHATIASQLDAFEDALGSAPDYVDGHQHVHQLPQIREILLQELQTRYADGLPWIRVSHPVEDGMKGRIISALGAHAMRQQALKRGFRMTDVLLGVYGFDSNASIYSNQLKHWLEAAVREAANGHICALMCHPGWLSHDETDPIRQSRPTEYQALSSPEFAAMLQTLNIRLEKGSRLLAGV
ncbi:ChbG/HpnK family deacetylase [Methylobacillus arboreus]|uniref:ChbG/HpnK family deacetylase n=1 Tax=Methylobacillus arboreus TaxID=755170 RepID=UPI001E45828F|nr:ChbG/HpnK family deacetylase [Methylobacillus arboreus]MCB5189849.1 ChbG/HpnK family deacetylase [Methylobacillus arboreus]